MTHKTLEEGRVGHTLVRCGCADWEDVAWFQIPGFSRDLEGLMLIAPESCGIGCAPPWYIVECSPFSRYKRCMNMRQTRSAFCPLWGPQNIKGNTILCLILSWDMSQPHCSTWNVRADSMEVSDPPVIWPGVSPAPSSERPHSCVESALWGDRLGSNPACATVVGKLLSLNLISHIGNENNNTSHRKWE